MIFTIKTCLRLLRYEPALCGLANGDIRENIFDVVVCLTSFSIVLSFLRLSNDLFSTSSTSFEGSVITSKHSALVPDVSASATGSNFKQLFARLSTLIYNRQSFQGCAACFPAVGISLIEQGWIPKGPFGKD